MHAHTVCVSRSQDTTPVYWRNTQHIPHVLYAAVHTFLINLLFIYLYNVCDSKFSHIMYTHTLVIGIINTCTFVYA